ncbi:hypothetical protein RMATCC62417_04080 [Rhizopus microsporus]|nr:hypothetical protein RMATCC62417_04080 [Rhizopus microsporus]
MLHSRPPSQNFFPGTLYSREIFVGDPYTFLFVKRGILQFVYVKPVLAVITMALKATNHYVEGDFSLKSSYFYITFIYNLSVSFCLWCLMVFFYATKKDLTRFRPLPKFLCVKAIIFFSFWQSVVVALLVFAGVIPEAEHMSVAIQDFLVCIEMVPFAIAHSFSFSYEDYFDSSVHSARMPIRIAIKDSLGLKDVYMDTVLTLRGSGFSYRSFEPSEGVPHMGSSRTSRIMAGLRYSNITSKKHWIEPAPTSKYITSGPGEAMLEEESEPLAFEEPGGDMEALYESSRRMEFGDYNYPVIDFREPIWRQVRQTSYGTTKIDSKGKPQIVAGPREGCIDVIVEQGKGNYVLVEDLIKQQQQQQQQQQPSQEPILARPPPPAARNHTLSKVRKDEPRNELTIQPSLSTPSHSSRYPQPQASLSTPLRQQPTQESYQLPPPQHSDSIHNDIWSNQHKASFYTEEEEDLLTNVWK